MENTIEPVFMLIADVVNVEFSILDFIDTEKIKPNIPSYFINVVCHSFSRYFQKFSLFYFCLIGGSERLKLYIIKSPL